MSEPKAYGDYSESVRTYFNSLNGFGHVDPAELAATIEAHAESEADESDRADLAAFAEWVRHLPEYEAQGRLAEYGIHPGHAAHSDEAAHSAAAEVGQDDDFYLHASSEEFHVAHEGTISWDDLFGDFSQEERHEFVASLTPASSADPNAREALA